MALPIAFERDRDDHYDPRDTLRTRLDAAPAEHAEALLEGYELLQKLHESGTLRMLAGALAAGDEILETAVGVARSEEATRATRNAIVIAKMLAGINPEILKGVAAAVSETLGSYDRPAVDPPGLLVLLSHFRRKETRRSLALLNRFLQNLGNRIKRCGDSKPQGRSST